MKAFSLAVRVGFCLATLVSPRLLRADDNIRVDVVVNTTDAGEKVPKASPEHPVYYYPWTAGYVELGQILHAQKPPPPSWDVQHALAKALAKKGYLLGKKNHPPSIVLILWWGYVAPMIDHPYGDFTGGSFFSGPSGGSTMVGLGTSNGQLYAHGDPNSAVAAEEQGSQATAANYQGVGSWMPAYTIMLTPNDHEMYLFVAGDKFEDYTGRDRVDMDSNELHEAAQHARYFLMVSALDYQAATKKKPVLLWCARVSTELAGRDLGDVLPTLIEAGAPQFGEDSGGPKFVTSPPITMGHVNVGTPMLKTDYPAKQ